MEDEPNEEELKAAINNLLWTCGPPRMALEDAERLACKWHSDLVAAWKAHRAPSATPRAS